MPHARIGDIDIHYEVSDYTDSWTISASSGLVDGAVRCVVAARRDCPACDDRRR